MEPHINRRVEKVPISLPLETSGHGGGQPSPLPFITSTLHQKEVDQDLLLPDLGAPQGFNE